PGTRHKPVEEDKVEDAGQAHRAQAGQLAAHVIAAQLDVDLAVGAQGDVPGDHQITHVRTVIEGDGGVVVQGADDLAVLGAGQEALIGEGDAVARGDVAERVDGIAAARDCGGRGGQVEDGGRAAGLEEVAGGGDGVGDAAGERAAAEGVVAGDGQSTAF